MAGSLFDQLKKAGLVDEKKAKKAKQQKYQQSKKNKGKKGQATQNDEAAIAAKQAQQQKVERDRQLNLERQQLQAQKADKAAIHQMIDTNKLSGFGGDEVFNFVDNNKVKTLYVNKEAHQQLADGRVRVVHFVKGYALLTKAVAEKVMQRDQLVVIPLAANDESLSKEDQDHYAQYEVPDDLSW